MIFKTRIPYIIVNTVLFCTTISAGAQDLLYSQYINHPLSVNPAMAGVSYGPRFGINSRSQWPGLVDGINSSYFQASLSYDQHFEAINSGIGVLLTTDKIAGSILVDNTIEVMYDYQFRIKNKSAFVIGISGSYINRKLHSDKLFYADQIDPIFGFSNTTSEPVPLANSLHRGDVSFGGLFYNKNFYGGFAVKHLLTPNISFWGDKNANMPVRVVFHAGMVFPFKHSRHKADHYFSPNLLIEMQKNFAEANLGGYFNVKYFYAGVFYRNNILKQDAVIILLGLRKGFFNIGYSYDISLSHLNKGGGGTHEISIIFNLDKKGEGSVIHRPAGILGCPDILNF